MRAGQNHRARLIFEGFAKAKPAHEYSATGAFKLAELQAAEDPAAGQRAFEAMFTAFPTSGLARRALALALATREEREGVFAVISYLEALSKTPLRKSELGQNIAYSLADAHSRGGDVAGAYAAYVAVANEWPYPFGAFFDDALFKAAEIDLARNEFERAIVLLERLLVEHETSSLMGTYHRPRMNAAALLVARIYEEKLGKRDKARDAYGRIYRQFATGTLRDDALWQQARLYRADADESAACGRLSKLVSEFPDSRYVPCAEGSCKDVKRKKESRAPRECRDYLQRGYLPDLARPALGEPGAVRN
jgi:tetratricopeptide (TPR) repeat protein